jgi:2-polyprenyl-6-methoxyphenol hydroxylase-like FAD-dependent oxidoreductase
MKDHETGVLVVGAGLQGAGVALELARRGVPVTIVEQDEVAFNRASLRNEGKVHLGLIYANDASRGTAFRQLEGALRFRAIVGRWLGEDSEWLVTSTPFHYLVARDSLLPPDALAAHYRAVEARCSERLAADPSLDYLGTRPDGLFRPLGREELSAHFDASRFQAGFSTSELAIDTVRLAGALRRALAASPRIDLRCAHTVRSIARADGGFRVEGEGDSGPWRIGARQVVNASWERRLALDRQLGLAPPPDLLHRLKFRVTVRLPDALRGAPSVSMVLGRYGDVVVRFDGTAYLSWYPAGMRGWSQDVEPPRAWDAACRGEVDPALAGDVARETLDGIDAWYPGMARTEPVLVDAGAIVAIGRTDVDDASSGLHDRTRIGVVSDGGYHSVDPGKLTTAPLFAVAAADRIEAFEAGQA